MSSRLRARLFLSAFTFFVATVPLTAILAQGGLRVSSHRARDGIHWRCDDNSGGDGDPPIDPLDGDARQYDFRVGRRSTATSSPRTTLTISERPVARR